MFFPVDHNFVFNSQKKYGLSDIQAAVVNGQAYCTFVRDASTDISGIKFDLDKDRFHIMVATGPVNPSEYCAYVCSDENIWWFEGSYLLLAAFHHGDGDMIYKMIRLQLTAFVFSSDGLSYHDKRTVSSGTVALDSFEAVEVRSDLFRTLHACFMVGAWICAASCGIIVARYFKKTWLKSRSCGIDQWFHVSFYSLYVFCLFPLLI